MTHADKVRDAERAVLDEAMRWWSAGDKDARAAAIRAIFFACGEAHAIRAETCPKCDGIGEHPDFDCGGTMCPAGCDNGKMRKEAGHA